MGLGAPAKPFCSILLPASDGCEATPPYGKLFKFGVADSSHMILLVESFSYEDWPAPNPYDPSEPVPTPTGFASPALVGGFPFRPAERFGSAGWQGIPTERFGQISAQICYFRHRAGKSPAGLGNAMGRLNIGFVDGHVALHSHSELFDTQTGKSTFLAMWSQVDRDID